MLTGVNIHNLLASKKDVQEVDRKCGKNRTSYLETDPIPFGKHVATFTHSGAVDEVVRFEDVGYADGGKSNKKDNRTKAHQRLSHGLVIILQFVSVVNRPLHSKPPSRGLNE